MQEMTTNHLQMPTWRWLKINESAIEYPQASVTQLQPLISGGETVRISKNVPLPEQVRPDLQAVRSLVLENSSGTLGITIPKNTTLSDPVVLNYATAEGALSEGLHIHAEEGSHAVIVLCYRGEGAHNGFTDVQVDKDARLTLIKAQLLSGGATHVDAVTAVVETNAHLEVLLAELGGEHVTASCDITLKGEGSSADLDSLYTGSGTKKQDLSYRLAFAGRETEGAITARGALNGKSRKVLKSTLDFIRGAQQAKGREEESVLMLGDKVQNLSAPLLLCGEDAVDGAHATSTGRPDPEKLFYLMSRGLSEESAKLLLVEASFTPILEKVQPQALREEILTRIQEVMHGGTY